MNSESSQDVYIPLKKGGKCLISYKQDELLTVAETEDSTTKNQSINSFTSTDHSLSADESEKELMHTVCVSTPQPKPWQNRDSFSSPRADFATENWSSRSLSGISMLLPSQGSDFLVDIQDGPVSSCEIPDAEMVSDAAREGDFESGDDTNAFQQRNEGHNDPLRDVGHPLHLFHNEQLVFQAISIWGINESPERTNQEDIAFNGIDIAGHLLEAAAAHMKRKVIVNESSLMAIANGLQLSIERCTGRNNPMIVHRGIGPMVADILLDSQTGVIMGFAVGRLVPHPVVNSSGGVQGSVMHQVTRGYAIDDNARRIIIEGVGSAICVVNNPPGK